MMRALLATLRVANAPSVVSNVATGYLLGRYYWGDAQAVGPVLLWLSLGALLLYFAGNLANDWSDRDWDKVHRPERALPRGIFRSSSYVGAALIAAALGVALAFVAGMRPGITALAILALIAIYTAVHKRSAWGVLPMGGCRAGLYLMGFLAAWPTDLGELPDDFWFPEPPAIYQDIVRSLIFIATHALGLLAYIAGLSLAARCESLPHPPRGNLILSRALLLLPLAALSCWWIPWFAVPGALALVPFAIWVALCLSIFRKPVPRLVSMLLAGIPLVDMIAAIPLGTALILPGGEIPDSVWVAFVLPPLAWLAALGLQKFTPAT